MGKINAIALVLGLALVPSSQATAQSASRARKFSLFAGATIVTSRYDAASGLGTYMFSKAGLEFSGEAKLSPRLGIVADVNPIAGGSLETTQTTLLFGPQISIITGRRLTPFAHAFFGLAHGTASQQVATPSMTLPRRTVFSTALGGGIDVRATGPLWIRLFQVDYLHADLAPSHHTLFRVSFGFVFRFR